MRHSFFLILAISMTLVLSCQQVHSDPHLAQLSEPRPIDLIPTVWLEDMTWMEVRDAIAEGKTRVLLLTGGTEQNGPFVALGKHNYICRELGERLALELKDTLVAPVVPFVPEGAHQPPEGHMRFQGTLSLSDETFKSLLRETVLSLKTHGFKEIVLLGDSGGNQQPLKELAQEFSPQWEDCRVIYIPEFYDYPKVRDWLKTQGLKERPPVYHEELAFSAQLAAINPSLIRHSQRKAKGLTELNGVDIQDLARLQELGERIIEFRVRMTKDAIGRATSK